MRVTNAMLSNNMLLGLNKNMNKLNSLYDQMNSLKKIQRPSDDPIILGRSLKLRLNVLETEQYKTNVGEAKSWMEVSDKAIDNTYKILDDIRKNCVDASNGPLKVDDRQKIMTTIEQLKKQIIQEANANYAGRNVFGGYKTDKKVLFDKKETMDPATKFKQSFGKEDLEEVTYREKTYYRIRLPYGNIDETPLNIEGLDDFGINGINGIDVVDSTQLPPDGESFYQPGDDQAYFLKDTGELIVSEETYKAIMAADDPDIEITYQKSEFKEGDPNPELFFNVADPDADPLVYTDPKESQKIEYEIGIGTKLDVNALGKDIFDPYMLRDIDELTYILEIYDDVEKGINGKDGAGGDKTTRLPGETINLSKLFSNTIGHMDEALKTVSSQQADLGSRISRLELTEKRLGDDEISFTELLSRTEDVDLERAFIDFNTQYMVYQSALQATSKVIQPTLMDFLR